MDNRTENRMDNSMDKHLSGDELCDFAEGILAESARVLAEKHLESCEACRRAFSITGAYFMAVGNLEPMPAPANFLANVRARLEQPSPWQAFWARFANPWRFVPAQLAVLTILGITILASYMYQNGGLGPATSVQPPSKPTSPIVSNPADAPSMPAPSIMKEVDRNKSSSFISSPDAIPETKAKSEKKENSQELGAGLRQEPVADDKVMQKNIVSHSPPSPAALKPKSAPSLEEAAETAPEAARSAPPSLAATREMSAPKPAEARERSKSVDAGLSKKSGASIADEALRIPEIVLQARNAKDTSTIISGLKAMGIEIVSESQNGSQDLMLKLSPSAIPEVLSYLEGYGKTEKHGKPMPASGTLTSISLRINLPNPLPKPK
jgi:hypothetical protein